MLKPIWLNDENEILELLHGLIKRLDKIINGNDNNNRDKTSAITLKKNTFVRDSTGDMSWRNLKILAEQNILLITNQNKNQYEYPWDRARVALLVDAGEIVREWLGLPKNINQSWALAVDEYAAQFEQLTKMADLSLLKKSPIIFPERSHQQVINALLCLLKNDNPQLTLRDLSAQYFWGDSKLFDAKQDWLNTIFPQLVYQARKININYYLPKDFQQILFVENLDTYQALIESELSLLQQTVIVYASGFLATANRIRELQSVSFHQSSSNQLENTQFINWWADPSNNKLDVYFWGDFDFSAMAILKALRNNFINAQAWLPGYMPMLRKINAADGHSMDYRKKQGQVDPQLTGCQYADEILLPTMRKNQQCFDQEGILLTELKFTEDSF